ncbi:MAG: hypothetical protein DLM64_13970 [Solirubrobacterales bacterium]|nr:MAG: hypothetical protein DLM64_13970 [Solirubrobacterales bacterium]
MNHRLRLPVAAIAALALGAPSAAAGSAGVAPVPSGSIVLGDPGQSQSMQSSTSASNAQQVGAPGSTSVGTPNQSNTQQSATHQSIKQSESGDFIIFNGGLHQHASEAASTQQSNDQLLGGSVGVGSPTQSNVQQATTNQSITQALSGTFVIFGGTRSDPAAAQSVNRLTACGVCADQLAGGPVLAGGNLSQTTGAQQSQAGTFVVFGDLKQQASNNSSTVETNNQVLSGSVIVGSPVQANNQAATTNQVIGQSMSGTFVIFGSLDQGATENASTVQSNKQRQGP